MTKSVGSFLHWKCKPTARRDGRPVPGLYAVGDGTRGIMVPGEVSVGYIEGTISALTFALVSGFVAGQEAAKYAE